MVRCIKRLQPDRARSSLATVLLSALILSPLTAPAETIRLSGESLLPIEFRRIQPNKVYFEADLLQIEVDHSASFLLHPFDETRNVRRVSFRWRGCGSLNKMDASHEASKTGDDAWLRIGLIQKGEPGLPNPFAPAWVKQVGEALKFPAGGVIYLVAGAKHKAGQRWPSPYSSDITMIAAGNVNTDPDGWKHAEHRFSKPVKIIGLWIMADGDNTMSTFTTQLKDLVIE